MPPPLTDSAKAVAMQAMMPCSLGRGTSFQTMDYKNTHDGQSSVAPVVTRGSTAQRS